MKNFLIILMLCISFEMNAQQLELFIKNYENKLMMSKTTNEYRTLSDKINYLNYIVGFTLKFKNNTFISNGFGYTNQFSRQYNESSPNLISNVNFQFRYLKGLFEYGKLYKVSDKIVGNINLSVPIDYKIKENIFDDYTNPDGSYLLNIKNYRPKILYVSAYLNSGMYYEIFPKFYTGFDIAVGQVLYFQKGTQKVITNETNKPEKIDFYKLNFSETYTNFIYNIGLRYQLGKK